jgi:hypothetical protein
MRLLSYVIALSNFYGGTGELFDLLESYRINEDEKSERAVKSNFPRNSPTPYSGLDRSYLLRRHQERHGYNQGTKMPFNGLQKRANREFRESKIVTKVREERNIQQAFSRKIKNHTYMKRHHNHWASKNFREKHK